MGMTYEYLVYDGKSSGDFGVWISGGGTYSAPGRDLEFVTIPGRNGDVVFDNGRYSNIEVVYPAFISRDFDSRVKFFRSWIGSKYGYKRLEDTYHPDEFRLASYVGGLEVETTPRNRGGRFDIRFNCKPQRYLKSGEVELTLSASQKIFNPTDYPARPLIRAYGTGTVTIAGVSVQVTTASGYTDIDCELMDAFKGSTNCNNNIVLSSGEFPTLPAGESTVSYSGFTSVLLTPRWWRL